LSLAVSTIASKRLSCLHPGHDKTDIQWLQFIPDRSKPGVTWSSW